MAKVIVYAVGAGTAAVCHPLISRDDPVGFTEDDAVARALRNDIPEDAVSISVIDAADLPARDYRNAWAVSGGAIEVDMEKARALHLTVIRDERNALLDATDKLFLKASEMGDAAKVAELSILRQRLRDIPTDIADTIAAAKDPTELKEVTSTALADAQQVIDSARTITRR